jgi:glycosyltransferase involved in cell wall biosynthesis
VRIAIIASPWLPVPPPAYGGTERVVDLLARGLQAAGHDVLLHTTGDSTCPVERSWLLEEALGTDGAGPSLEAVHTREGYRVAAEWRADIVHDHTLAGPMSAARSTLPFPVVTTNHGPFDGDLGPVYRRFAHEVPVLAISHSQASGADGIPVERVIHHALDLSEYTMGDGRPGGAVFLGRMCADKGAHRAIEAARLAGMPLRIAAKMREPAERAYFEACIRPHLGHDVEYLGEVGGADRDELLGSATCLVNPIAWPEPFGLVMIEALACGTPVVTSPWGAAPEIVDHGVTGFLVEGPEALAAAIHDAATLDRDQCRAAVAERFSTERMVAEHVAAYEDVRARWLAKRSTPTTTQFDAAASLQWTG